MRVQHSLETISRFPHIHTLIPTLSPEKRGDAVFTSVAGSARRRVGERGRWGDQKSHAQPGSGQPAGWEDGMEGAEMGGWGGAKACSTTP